MTTPSSLEYQHRLPLRRRVLPLIAVAVAAPLAKMTPRRIRRALEFARRGAGPASESQALAARSAVVAVSLRCAGNGCLQRSIAAALYCRALGVWPTWCVGVRTEPFQAHAWIQVNERPVGEPYPAGHFRPLITVPVRDSQTRD
jgi:hypothetical protein